MPPQHDSNLDDNDDNTNTYTYASFNVPRGLTYHYIHLPPAAAPTVPAPASAPNPSPTPATKPYILLLHGFPSHPNDFHHQIDHLSTQLGFGIIAPVLLGYRPSSAPLDPSLYRLKLLSHDLTALLDHLAIKPPVHAIGHDWGCTILSRLEFYHPKRLGADSKLAYLTIAPSPFGRASAFDLAAVNAATEQQLGYAAFGYQDFFVREPMAAAALMAQRHERMEMLMFAGGEGEAAARLWRDYFGRIGGLETWLLRGTGEHEENDADEKGEEEEDAPMLEAVTASDLRLRRGVFEEVLMENGSCVSGYAGPIMYYLALNGNLNVEDEKERLAELRKSRKLSIGRREAEEEADADGYQTDKHVLQVLCDKDPIALPQIHAGMARAYVKDPDRQLGMENLYSGHFVMYEQHEELSVVLEEFFA